MKCPFCGFIEDKVVDSRESREGAHPGRRECLRCERRFTHTSASEIPYMAIQEGRGRELSIGTVMAGCCAPVKSAGALFEVEFDR